MKRIPHHATVLTATLFLAVSVAVASEAEPQAKPEPEEFLAVRVLCEQFMPDMPGTLDVNFSGSGDLRETGLSVVVLTECSAAVDQLRTTLEGLDLPCETSLIGERSGSVIMGSACQATRAELVNVMGEVGTAVVTLPATPTP